MAYDVIVIGGGHAGAEAAWASVRMGMSTALVTISIDAIGRMSCNPAIGGLGKGQIVREIDALGGLMGLTADAGGIQFRMLNRSKGPAVWAPRAQADRVLYAGAVLEKLQSVDGLDLIEALVDSLMVEQDEAHCSDPDPAATDSCKPDNANVSNGTARLKVVGVRLQGGRDLRCRAVVLAPGTFLCGLMHCGELQTQGGRINEKAAMRLSENLRRLGFTLGRLKTGTPPRVHRDSVDFAQLTAQPGDDPPMPFSFMTDILTQPQIDCWITHTNQRTHQLIRDNIDRAPMYSGQIKSRGPRYCPSIEDKVMRFADKGSHQLFLEPEGYDDPLIYCNGIPTSLPVDVQEPLVHSITGLHKARIVQYGYAIEYDWVPTDQISATLESKRVAGLYLAGQINGTSGYEEAAGQGLLAAINAVARILNREPVVLGRDEAYIGVMIDDIVTRPPDEPYRMFTSRAEYRLHLRSDNADLRLTPIGRRVGLVDDRRWARFERKRLAMQTLEDALNQGRLDGQSLAEWIRRPHVVLEDLCARVDGLTIDHVPAEVLEAVQIRLKYAGYLAREQRLIERHKRLESRMIPDTFDYAGIATLRYEAREKFIRFRPRNLGQAARISGISPADIATLSLYLARRASAFPAESAEPLHGPA